MKHYIYRNVLDGGRMILACDAEDITSADKNLKYHFDNLPTKGITAEVKECVILNEHCVLPHSVGDRRLIKLAPDKKPKVSLRPPKIPGYKLLTHPRDFYNQCFYCGLDMSGQPKIRTKDHVTPRSKGGKVKVPCCLPCNQLKGQLKLEEYRVMVAYRNGLIPLDILQQVKFKGEELVEFDTE